MIKGKGKGGLSADEENSESETLNWNRKKNLPAYNDSAYTTSQNSKPNATISLIKTDPKRKRTAGEQPISETTSFVNSKLTSVSNFDNEKNQIGSWTYFSLLFGSCYGFRKKFNELENGNRDSLKNGNDDECQSTNNNNKKKQSEKRDQENGNLSDIQDIESNFELTDKKLSTNIKLLEQKIEIKTKELAEVNKQISRLDSDPPRSGGVKSENTNQNDFSNPNKSVAKELEVRKTSLMEQLRIMEESKLKLIHDQEKIAQAATSIISNNLENASSSFVNEFNKKNGRTDQNN